MKLVGAVFLCWSFLCATSLYAQSEGEVEYALLSLPDQEMLNIAMVVRIAEENFYHNKSHFIPANSKSLNHIFTVYNSWFKCITKHHVVLVLDELRRYQ